MRRELLSKEMTTVPQWPTITANVESDGTGELNLGPSSKQRIAEQSVEDARAVVLQHVAAYANENHHRAVRLRVQDPDGEWVLGWRSRWPRRRSPACCGSAGTRSGGSSSGSSQTTSTSGGWSGLVAIGVDEISYRRGQRYLTTRRRPRAGTIVWCAPGRNAATLQAFFDLLGERKQLDPGGLDRHVRRLRARRSETRIPARRDLRLTRSTSCASRSAPSTRSAATSGTPTSAPTPRGQVDQGHPLVAAEGPRQADDRPARAAARGPARQQAALPRVPAQRRTPAALPARGPHARPGAPGRVAGLGIPITARAVHQASIPMGRDSPSRTIPKRTGRRRGPSRRHPRRATACHHRCGRPAAHAGRPG